MSQGKPDGPLVGDHKPGMELDGLDSQRHELSYLKDNLEFGRSSYSAHGAGSADRPASRVGWQ